MYQTLKTLFDLIFKHLEARHKYSATCRIFNSLLAVWNVVKTFFRVWYGTQMKT